MSQKKQPEHQAASSLIPGKIQDQAKLLKIAKSGEAQQLAAMLKQNGKVEEAAKAAAAGDTSQLMEMIQKLMKNPEGAQLIDRINQQAQETTRE